MKRRSVSWILIVVLILSTGCGKTEEAVGSVTAPAPAKEEVIQALIQSMTIDEKVGQLLMSDLYDEEVDNNITVLTEKVKKDLARNDFGGIILFSKNLDTAEQTKALITALQEETEIPLFIGIDEEGGRVSRLRKSNIPHEIIPPPGEMKDIAEVRAAAQTIARELIDLGFNVDFAPVADVNTNPDNPVIGTRAFSSDANIAAERVGAFVQVLEEEGVSGAAKHFPGHGDTVTDSHAEAVFVTHTLERLREVEFVPFREAIQQGVDFVMLGHIQTPNATSDGLPATLSKESVGLLRNELGYEGIIITDAMNMGAIIKQYGSGEATVLSILAGVDMVLMPADMEEAVLALRAATASGRISEERIDESLTKIFSLKYDKGLLKVA